MSGLDFSRVSRDGDLCAAASARPWLVLVDVPGAPLDVGLWRFLPGGFEWPVTVELVRDGKLGFRISSLPAGVYLARTGYADAGSQHRHFLHASAEGLAVITLEQVLLLALGLPHVEPPSTEIVEGG